MMFDMEGGMLLQVTIRLFEWTLSGEEFTELGTL